MHIAQCTPCRIHKNSLLDLLFNSYKIKSNQIVIKVLQLKMSHSYQFLKINMEMNFYPVDL